jgi:hypothetical protein
MENCQPSTRRKKIYTNLQGMQKDEKKFKKEDGNGENFLNRPSKFNGTRASASGSQDKNG